MFSDNSSSSKSNVPVVEIQPVSLMQVNAQGGIMMSDVPLKESELSSNRAYEDVLRQQPQEAAPDPDDLEEASRWSTFGALVYTIEPRQWKRNTWICTIVFTLILGAVIGGVAVWLSTHSEEETHYPINGKCFENRGELILALDGYESQSRETILQTYGRVRNWCVSNITDFSLVFYSRPNFNEKLDGWDVSSAWSLDRMFEGATAFNQDLSMWDTSGVRDMRRLFHFATAFNGDVSRWDVSAVEDMSSVFAGAAKFNRDLSSWDVSSVMIMPHVFQGASSFNQDISSWNVASVTDMSYAFYQASSFNIDLSSWDVSSVEKMGRMFGYANSFKADLCPWGQRLEMDTFAQDFLKGTNCPISDDPDFTASPPGPFCFACSS